MKIHFIAIALSSLIFAGSLPTSKVQVTHDSIVIDNSSCKTENNLSLISQLQNKSNKQISDMKSQAKDKEDCEAKDEKN